MIRCCSSTVSAMPPREALGFKGADDSFHESFILGLADAGEEMGGGAGSEAFEELAVGFRCRDDLRGSQALDGSFPGQDSLLGRDRGRDHDGSPLCEDVNRHEGVEFATRTKPYDPNHEIWISMYISYPSLGA